jgi:hypothetical protein
MAGERKVSRACLPTSLRVWWSLEYRRGHLCSVLLLRGRLGTGHLRVCTFEYVMGRLRVPCNSAERCKKLYEVPTNRLYYRPIMKNKHRVFRRDDLGACVRVYVCGCVLLRMRACAEVTSAWLCRKICVRTKDHDREQPDRGKK